MVPGSAILTYHSLDDSGSVISVRPDVFVQQMDALAALGVPVVRLTELLSVPAPALALTFDDGFENFAGAAAGVLLERRFPATVFVVPGYCGGCNDWPTQSGVIPRMPLMNWSKIEELSRNGIEFGAHTMSHPNLTLLQTDEAAEEILSSKKRVEDGTGRPVLSFAYPYGAMNNGLRSVVRENFSVGCSTRLGWVTSSSAAEALERLDVYYLSSLRLFRRLFGRSARCYLSLRSVLREWNPQHRFAS